MSLKLHARLLTEVLHPSRGGRWRAEGAAQRPVLKTESVPRARVTYRDIDQLLMQDWGGRKGHSPGLLY